MFFFFSLFTFYTVMFLQGQSVSIFCYYYYLFIYLFLINAIISLILISDLNELFYLSDFYFELCHY